MIKKTVTYEDYNGVKRTEDFYFNLSKAEIARMEMEEAQLVNGKVVQNGLYERLKRVVERGLGKEIISTFEDLLRRSYGVRSEDGRRFIKNDEVWEEFSQSAAYDELFISIVTDAEAAADFVNGIVPADLEEFARKKPQDRKDKQVNNNVHVVPEPSKIDEYNEALSVEVEPVQEEQISKDELEEFRKFKAQQDNKE